MSVQNICSPSDSRSNDKAVQAFYGAFVAHLSDQILTSTEYLTLVRVAGKLNCMTPSYFLRSIIESLSVQVRSVNSKNQFQIFIDLNSKRINDLLIDRLDTRTIGLCRGRLQNRTDDLRFLRELLDLENSIRGVVLADTSTHKIQQMRWMNINHRISRPTYLIDCITTALADSISPLFL